jgi:hypothetical protein
VAVLTRAEHRFSWWHQGVVLFDRTYVWSEECTEYVEAASGAWLGQSLSRAVTFVAPGGGVFSSEDAPLTVESLDGPPPLPAGEWRARWSGFGELAAEEREYAAQPDAGPRPDRYLLQLWPLSAPGPVVIHRGH